MAVFCFPCKAGDVAEMVGGSYLLNCCCACTCIFPAFLRGAVRERHGIPGNFAHDCLSMVACGPCALVQEIKQILGAVPDQKLSQVPVKQVMVR